MSRLNSAVRIRSFPERNLELVVVTMTLFPSCGGFALQLQVLLAGSMPFCVELDNLKDTDAPIHQPAAMLVAAD